ncbi:MAG TPA: CHAP domain-containing protein [Ktedonobacteraceae bacterium]|nr:CHAP domain-containing protein [Ktedonobacteraceae bacterium]
MSSSENQQRGPSEGLQIPGLVQSQEPIEQLSFSIDPLTPMPLATPTYPDEVPDLADASAPLRPISQAGITQTPQAPHILAGYLSGSSSLPGLEDRDTERQPIAVVDTADTDTQFFQSASSMYPGGSSSLPGLADMDTAHQPISQVGLADTERPQPAPAGYPGGPSSVTGFGDINATPQPISQTGLGGAVVPQAFAPPGTTRALVLNSLPGITRTLEETRAEPGTTASRPPVVIRGSNQSRAHSIRPPEGRRHVISIAALLLLLVITGGMLAIVSPLGRNVISTLSGQAGKAAIVQNTPSNMNLVAQATATAVVHQQNDGYDPTSNGGGPVVTGSPRSWPLGVCTYWANLRYHELSGHWVTWTGNAYQWADGARLAGWHVSTSPHVPSIIVLMPGVQGASGYGHVAVVESANGNSVYTSNMNWYTNGGGWDIKSYNTFSTGSGVYFIWAD